MRDILLLGQKAGLLLKERGEKIAVGEPGLSWSALNGTPRRRTPGHGWPGRGQMGELKSRHGWHSRFDPLTF